MIVIVGIFVISMTALIIYVVVHMLNSDKPQKETVVVEKPGTRKVNIPEPTVKVICYLYDKSGNNRLSTEEKSFPRSQAAFFIPNYKDTIIISDEAYTVKSIERDFSSQHLVIKANKQ